MLTFFGYKAKLKRNRKRKKQHTEKEARA